MYSIASPSPCILIVVVCTDTPHNVSIAVDQARLSGLVMVVTKEMEVITISDNVYNMLGINMVGMDGRNSFYFICAG